MRVQRQAYVDLLERDGETAVLFAGTVVRLSALGAAIFRLSEAPIDVAELAVELEELFGPPDHGTAVDATQAAVSELLLQGVINDHSRIRGPHPWSQPRETPNP